MILNVHTAIFNSCIYTHSKFVYAILIALVTTEQKFNSATVNGLLYVTYLILNWALYNIPQ